MGCPRTGPRSGVGGLGVEGFSGSAEAPQGSGTDELVGHRREGRQPRSRTGGLEVGRWGPGRSPGGLRDGGSGGRDAHSRRWSSCRSRWGWREGAGSPGPGSRSFAGGGPRKSGAGGQCRLPGRGLRPAAHPHPPCPLGIQLAHAGRSPPSSLVSPPRLTPATLPAPALPPRSPAGPGTSPQRKSRNGSLPSSEPSAAEGTLLWPGPARRPSRGLPK